MTWVQWVIITAVACMLVIGGEDVIKYIWKKANEDVHPHV